MTQIFISYAKEDGEIAKKLYDDLKKNGARPWMDKEDILIGQNWKFAIRQAITKIQYFLALLSSNSVTKRGYVQEELKLALEVLDELPQSDIFILPILLEECQVSDERLSDLHWGDLYSSYDACLNQVLRVVCKEVDDENMVEIRRENVVTIQTQPVDTPKPRYSLRIKPMNVNSEKAEITFKVVGIGWWLLRCWISLEYYGNCCKNNEDGTISDLATGLMWQQSCFENALNYKNAKKLYPTTQ